MKSRLTFILAAIGVVGIAASLAFQFFAPEIVRWVVTPDYEAPASKPVVEGESATDMDVLLDEYGEEPPPELGDDLEAADIEEEQPIETPQGAESS